MTIPAALPDDWADTPVTVVMPTYNEIGSLEATVEQVMALPLPGLHLKVVDDSSPDGTGELAEKLAERHTLNGRSRISVLHRKGKDGLGKAYAAGMSLAVEEGAQYVVQMDADGSHPALAIPQMLGTALSTGAGVVVGSRYVPGGELADEWGWHRRLLSRWANAYAGTILSTRVRDITAGFNLWSAEALHAVDLASLESAGYSFQVELKFRAVHKGFSALEIPIRFEERRAGESKMSFGVQLESALVPWRLRLRSRSK
ncbi:dolichol-phosphate mannosyltransferase [Streptacidiphilus jiangxiensis]|uniref:Dolichol-phosphate mannosyltransferase n=2 Tax=Streptacidiphilus jiangxiensis TaxID=235985 RepID=A0A1H7FDS8_STRJI|nr:dolichol-phosphate mannosyltransferase [Streptacidiphilus jiangxiensis]